MKTEKKDYFSTDETAVWIEDESSIHLRAITHSGDPVELTSHEAKQLGEVLIQLSEKLR